MRAADLTLQPENRVPLHLRPQPPAARRLCLVAPDPHGDRAPHSGPATAPACRFRTVAPVPHGDRAPHSDPATALRPRLPPRRPRRARETEGACYGCGCGMSRRLVTCSGPQPEEDDDRRRRWSDRLLHYLCAARHIRVVRGESSCAGVRPMIVVCAKLRRAICDMRACVTWRLALGGTGARLRSESHREGFI